MEGSVNYALAYAKTLQCVQLKLKVCLPIHFSQLEEEKKTLEDLFGPVGLFNALRELQDFLDTEGGKLIDQFTRDYKLDRQVLLLFQLPRIQFIFSSCFVENLKKALHNHRCFFQAIRTNPLPRNPKCFPCYLPLFHNLQPYRMLTSFTTRSFRH